MVVDNFYKTFNSNLSVCINLNFRVKIYIISYNIYEIINQTFGKVPSGLRSTYSLDYVVERGIYAIL